MSGELPPDWFRPEPSGTNGDEDASTPTLPAAGASPYSPHSPELLLDGDGQGVAAITAGTSVPVAPEPGSEDQVDGPRRGIPQKQAAPSPDDAMVDEPMPVVTSAHRASEVDVGWQPTPPGRGAAARRLWLVLVSVVALALGAGLSGGTLVRRQLDSRAAAASSTGVASSNGATALSPWTGATRPLAVQKASATCTVPDGPDASGDWTTYGVGNLLDNNLGSAWRCNGDGVGQRIVFAFAPDTELVGVGIVNGYAKQASTVSLYDQYRRVVTVRWDLPNGSWFIQQLSENSQMVQQLRIPPTVLSGPLQLTIQQTSAPGVSNDTSRNAVLLSTVTFYTRP
ncbi:NADase-type glycan-binding domain-containing protein [Propionibacteriaceae bacterium G57]|uniref:NADase-type glycan-binding domain-containing protein n=1 Tax=Aestuariimicrobium sp. G57 TaxID=3418485 RepID=UPI003DA71A0B